MDERAEGPLPFTAMVRSQGRVTIPDPVRRALGIREGDLVHLTVRKVVEARGPRP